MWMFYMSKAYTVKKRCPCFVWSALNENSISLNHVQDHDRKVSIGIEFERETQKGKNKQHPLLLLSHGSDKLSGLNIFEK